MKKKIFWLTILILGISNSNAQTTDFRIFSWGNSIEKVKSDEKAPFYAAKNGDELEFDDKLGGTKFKVLYIFNENNKLISGIYIFAKKYSNTELYYQDYSVFLKLLKEKYGKATNEKETWNTSDSLYDKSNKKQAIADKNLNLYAVWNTERTTIKITLISIGNEVPSMQIHYTAAALDELKNQIDLKDALNKL
jgi:hypothetical protein